LVLVIQESWSHQRIVEELKLFVETSRLKNNRCSLWSNLW